MEYHRLPQVINDLETTLERLGTAIASVNYPTGKLSKASIGDYWFHLPKDVLIKVLEAEIKSVTGQLEKLRENHETIKKIADSLLK